MTLSSIRGSRRVARCMTWMIILILGGVSARASVLRGAQPDRAHESKRPKPSRRSLPTAPLRLAVRRQDVRGECGDVRGEVWARPSRATPGGADRAPGLEPQLRLLAALALPDYLRPACRSLSEPRSSLPA